MSRFEQAMHYVVSTTKPDELGKTKLAKVLFYADLEAFRRTGSTITESKYIKLPRGPVPQQFYATIDNLAREGKIAQKRQDLFGKEQHQFWSTSAPDLSGLTAQDVALLSEVTKEICGNHTASSISDLTHNAAWNCAEDNEEIPLSAFLVASLQVEPTAAELGFVISEIGRLDGLESAHAHVG